MILVKFRNLEKSKLVRKAVIQRIEPVVEKFPHLAESRISVTIEMANSPFQAGPDLFIIKVFIVNGRYGKISIEKSDSNMYVALADLAENMLEVLNRFGDKTRVKQRKLARAVHEEVEMKIRNEEQKTG